MIKNQISKNRERIASAIMIVLFFVITGCVFQFVSSQFLGIDLLLHHAKRSPLQKFVLVLSSTSAIFLAVFLFKKFVDKEAFAATGLCLIRFKDVFAGMMGGFILGASGFLMLILTGEIIFESNVFSPVGFLLSCGTLLMVAISEELLVRGYILGNLAYAMNKYIALCISALFFSLMHAFDTHYNWITGIELFLAGILFGLSYIHIPNLGFPIALHFSWSFFQETVFGFNVTASSTYTFITPMWNGRTAEFNGSILFIGLELAAIVAVYWWMKKRASVLKHKALMPVLVR